MGKLALAMLATTSALALSGGPAAAYTATIFDAYAAPLGSGAPAYSQGYAGGWHDNYNYGVNNPGPFSSGNVYVTWSGDDVIIDLTSNMPLNGSSGYGFADIFFDLKAVDGYGGANTPDWDYGLDINSGRTADGSGGFGQQTTTDTSVGSATSYNTVKTESALGAGDTARLVKLDSSADYAYSAKDEVEWTEVCTEGNCGAATTGRRPEVEVVKSDYIAEYDVQTLAGPNPPDHTYRIVLAGVNADGLWDEFRLFWATGWCANDTVEGYVTRVPLPAALPIIGAALAGFGFAGWRQRQPA